MEQNKKTVCVTGASGYIASYIVKQLLEKGYTVHGTVRDPNDKKKVEHLLNLQNASTHLKLFKAELDAEGAFDEPFKGCHAVIHVASPYFYVSKDPQKEIIDPAVNGMKNVLKSVEKAGVKVVIATSSGTAMFFRTDRAPTHHFNEEDWSDIDFLKKINQWYPLSKTLSEKVFWEWAETVKGKIRSIVVAPSFVSGPPLQDEPNTSNNGILSMVDGFKKTVANSPVPLADVRDVATAHVLALEKEDAQGRYFCGAEGTNFIGIANTLRKLFPERSQLIPSQVELKEGEQVRPAMKIDNSKIKALGVNFIDAETSLKETVEASLKKGFLKQI